MTNKEYTVIFYCKSNIILDTSIISSDNQEDVVEQVLQKIKYARRKRRPVLIISPSGDAMAVFPDSIHAIKVKNES